MQLVPVFTFWLAVATLILLTLTVRDTWAETCPASKWGPTCEGVCHCALKTSQCADTDGRCAEGGCSRGFTGAPFCQTPCRPGTFGLGCSMTCHCPEGDVCDHVNGLCSSNHCLAGYEGAGCQTRIPVFLRPPNITFVSAQHITVTWRPWSPALDLGVPPVAQYHLQYKTQDSDWLTYDVINVTSGVQEPTSYSRTVIGVVALMSYKFRLALARGDDGKVGVPFPGPSTDSVKACSAPTQEPLHVSVFQELQQNNLSYISLRWTAPDSSTSGCTSIGSHQVTLQCDHGVCPTLMASVPMPGVTFTFSNVRSDVDKEVRVAAVNDAGQTGPPDILFLMALTTPTLSSTPLATSVPLQGATTGAPRPDTGGGETSTAAAVGSLECLAATETSLELTWPDVHARKYEVVLLISDSYRMPHLVGQIQQKIALSGTYLLVHSLHAATLYGVTVTPDTSRDIFSGSMWTEPQQPPSPPNPAVLRVTNQTAVLYIKPVAINTGPLTAYHIVVEQLSRSLLLKGRRTKRQAGGRFENLKGYEDAKDEGINYYMAAELTGSTLTAGINFTVGDGRTYNRYTNVPLQENTKYRVWIGLVSTLAGVTKRTFVNVEGKATDGSTFTTLPTNPTVEVGAVTAEDSSKTGLALGLFFLILALLLLGVAIYFIRKKGCPSFVVEFWENHQDFRSRYFLRRQRATSLFASVDKIDVNTKGPEIQVPIKPGYNDDFYIMKKSSSVSVDDFIRYYQTRKKASLEEEFRMLLRGMTATAYVAKSVQNLHLNQHNHIIPYDVNRLCMLTRSKGENDYINATLLRGLQDKPYIVTQTPLPLTIPHFWRVVWDYRISRVVMLLELPEDQSDKCLEYWSKGGKPQWHGPLRVTLVKEERFAFYTVRSFEMTLQSENEVRYVRHFQYTDWQKPTGIPGSVIPFLDFIQRCQRNVEPAELCVVHCLYGGGRSGLFLAIETLLQQARMTGQVDILKCVTLLRMERVGLVKTLSQYQFIHEALFHALSYKESVVNGNTFRTYMDNLIFVAQGAKTCMQREFENMLKMTLASENAQDRFMSPAKSSLPMGKASLSRPASAVTLLDSHRHKGFYVILDHPTESQIGAFWKNIQDFNCSCVVRLSDPDDSLFPFIPDCGENCQYGDMDVYQANATKLSNHLTERTIGIRIADLDGSNPPTKIDLFHLHWRDEKSVPNVRAMLDLCQRVELAGDTNPGRVAVVSGPVMNRSGLFCACAVLLNKMEVEGEVDIYTTVKHLRTQMPQAVAVLEQYRFCYRFIKEHLRQTGKAMDTTPEFNTSLPHRPFKSPFQTSTPKNVILVKEARNDQAASPRNGNAQTPNQGLKDIQVTPVRSPSKSNKRAARSKRSYAAASRSPGVYMEGSGEATSSGVENLDEDLGEQSSSWGREKVQVGEIGDLQHPGGALGGSLVEEERNWQALLREAARLRQHKTPMETERGQSAQGRAQRQGMLYGEVDSDLRLTQTLPSPSKQQYGVAPPKPVHVSVDDATCSVENGYRHSSPKASSKNSSAKPLSPSQKKRARLDRIGKALPNVGGKRR